MWGGREVSYLCEVEEGLIYIYIRMRFSFRGSVQASI